MGQALQQASQGDGAGAGGQGPAGGLRETVGMGMRALHMGKEHALS